MSEAVSVT